MFPLPGSLHACSAISSRSTVSLPHMGRKEYRMTKNLRDYVKSLTSTPQSQPIPGSKQVPNSGGGYAWAVDDWVRLDRFLILGAEQGTYYITERRLTEENAEAVARCIADDGPRTVQRIVEVSEAGRAPKNDPAIFALALCAAYGNPETKKVAFD